MSYLSLFFVFRKPKTRPRERAMMAAIMMAAMRTNLHNPLRFAACRWFLSRPKMPPSAQTVLLNWPPFPLSTLLVDDSSMSRMFLLRRAERGGTGGDWVAIMAERRRPDGNEIFFSAGTITSWMSPLWLLVNNFMADAPGSVPRSGDFGRRLRWTGKEENRRGQTASFAVA